VTSDEPLAVAGPGGDAALVLATDQQVIEFCGQQFLEYVLAGADWGGAASGTGAARDVADVIRFVVGAALASGDQEIQQRGTFISMMSEVRPAGNSLVNELRVQAGGSIPSFHLPACTSRSLAEFVLALFAFELMPPEKDPFPGPGFSNSFFLRTLTTPFMNQILGDDEFSSLFPGVDVESVLASKDPHAIYRVASNLIWSTGQGGTLQLAVIPSLFAGFTIQAMRLEGKFELQRIEEFAVATDRIARALVVKRRAIVPLTVAFSNLSVTPQERAEVGEVVILNSADIGGLNSIGDEPTTAVALMATELRLFDILEMPSEPSLTNLMAKTQHRRPAMAAHERAIAIEVDRLRLAMALASDGQLIAPIVRSRVVHNPFLVSYGWVPDQTPIAGPFPAASLSRVEFESLADWSARATAHPRSMWLGARRILSAISERMNPLDGFIDAVVCWENMLGAETEVTFRVCAGLALLVEPSDPIARVKVFRELQELYRTRSGLIHGSREPDDAEAVGLRDRAVGVALQAMRAIYERPELLDADSSGERNRRLMLGA
jgi:hypothetical protein